PGLPDRRPGAAPAPSSGPPGAGYCLVMTETPSPDHQVPDGVDQATVDAVGRLTKGLEVAEWARGHLYAFHQLSGEANRHVEDAIPMLRDAGHPEWADRLERELFGRNVLDGRWTFQIVEEYDDGYWTLFRELERAAPRAPTRGRRHPPQARGEGAGRPHRRPAAPARGRDEGGPPHPRVARTRCPAMTRAS